MQENNSTKQNFTNGLFIFHRDFRLIDNVGLIQASKLCDNLYTCFIFTPEQVGKANTFRSQNAIQFMIESLTELEKDIREQHGELVLFYGEQLVILRKLCTTLNIDAVFFNQDYTPYAVNRDKETAKLCEEMQKACLMFSDYYLFEPGKIVTGNGKGNAYKKFTPFYDEVLHHSVEPPKTHKITNFVKVRPGSQITSQISLKNAFAHFTKNNPDILVHGGRSNGIQQLKKAIREQTNYAVKRDYLIENTTFLSAHLKFGCVSVREAHSAFVKAFGKKNELSRQLIWREFFAHVLYSYPEVVGKSYQPRYRNLGWTNSRAAFEKWKNGETGFPIVDASMRQLNTTGYMHNRGRMMVASFLIKVLLIDWRWGEKYFAQHLTDYDIASNNGNWQGISGTGVDMKPYFRDMNPWIQSAKLDPDTLFIKKWVPELADVDPRDIHKWHTEYNNPKYKMLKYFKPMVDYGEQKEKMLKMYQNA
jgi:deoxyribodipyrimidine photo-lyase